MIEKEQLAKTSKVVMDTSIDAQRKDVNESNSYQSQTAKLSPLGEVHEKQNEINFTSQAVQAMSTVKKGPTLENNPISQRMASTLPTMD